MAIHRRLQASGLTLAVAAAAVVALVLMAVLTALPSESVSIGESTVANVYRVLLGGAGGIALGVLLVTLINRVTR